MRKIPETVGQNAGLALSRYVPPKEDVARRRFFRAVAEIKADIVYAAAFQRWKATLTARKALVATGTLGGPLAVGLGNEGPYEVGLTLHRVYGMPLIPGSALKGACLRALGTQGTATKDAANALFGTTESAGCAVFHDAWFDPSSVAGTPLTCDTVTVHHPGYYRGKGQDGVFPTDFDDPNPVPFVAVRPGAAFLFGIEIPGADSGWLDFAEGMFRHTLTEIGLGGKTNAGYGWFREVTYNRPVTPEALLAPIRARIESIRAAQDTGQIPNILAAIDALEETAVRRDALLQLRSHLQAKRFWKPDKAMYQNIDQKIEETPL